MNVADFREEKKVCQKMLQEIPNTEEDKKHGNQDLKGETLNFFFFLIKMQNERHCYF